MSQNKWFSVLKVFFTAFVFCLISFSSQLLAGDCDKNSIGKVGGCVPAFSIKDLSEKNYQTVAAGSGKVHVIHFWATWCKPCAEELPALRKFYENLDHQSVKFIAISIDQEGKGALDRFFKNIFDNKWPDYPIAIDADKKVASLFGTQKVPETFIVNPEGEITVKIVGKRNWEYDPVLDAYLSLLTQKK